uniref:FYVE-type domain-containing protein n=1 Tax=Globisporangium ultimum (strain ATCC 200006 / CBS 805.95 / DAOM BR144) TaxID=431595 RepID=K3WFB3_GLOUD
MITPDSSEFMLRTAYVDDHIQDGAVLYQMLMPTPDAPFRFFGIKWYVKDIPLQYKKLVWPRDFVFVESLGTLTRRDGTRLGYMIRHPVNLTSCGDLTAHGVIRGSFTSCGIYTQLPNNEVDIYVRGKADPAGKMSKSLGISLTAHALLSASNAPNCSRHKKLMGLIRRAVENVTPTERTTRYACGACAKKFGALTTIKTCKICRLQMCSRCRLRRSLSFVNEDNNFAVEQLMAIICINCLAQATHASAFEIARDEVLSGRYGPVPKEQKQPKQQEDEQQKSAVLLDEFQLKTTLTPTSSADDVSSLQLKVDRITSLKLLKHDILTETLSESSFPSSFDESVTEVVTGDEIDVEGTTAAAASAPGATVTNLLNPNEERQELWRKMSELRLQAESAYQLTKQTTALFNMGMQGATSSADVSVASDADEEEQDEA